MQTASEPSVPLPADAAPPAAPALAVGGVLVELDVAALLADVPLPPAPVDAAPAPVPPPPRPAPAPAPTPINSAPPVSRGAARPAATEPHGDRPPGEPPPPVVLVAPPPAEVPSRRQRRAARRLQARKVGRLVRHVDLWSVLKVSLLFHLSAFLVTLFAGVLLWAIGVNTGVVADVEGFIREAFALQTFAFEGGRIFRAAVLGGLALVLAATAFTVLLAALFNLMSDLVGGVRFTVVEEETARPLALVQPDAWRGPAAVPGPRRPPHGVPGPDR